MSSQVTGQTVAPTYGVRFKLYIRGRVPFCCHSIRRPNNGFELWRTVLRNAELFWRCAIPPAKCWRYAQWRTKTKRRRIITHIGQSLCTNCGVGAEFCSYVQTVLTIGHLQLQKGVVGPQVHAKFQRNRPIRYRDTAGGTFVTSPQVARATCHSWHWHDSAWGPMHGRRDGGYPSKKTACQSGLRFQRYKPLKSVTTAGLRESQRAWIDIAMDVCYVYRGLLKECLIHLCYRGHLSCPIPTLVWILTAWCSPWILWPIDVLPFPPWNDHWTCIPCNKKGSKKSFERFAGNLGVASPFFGDTTPQEKFGDWLRPELMSLKLECYPHKHTRWNAKVSPNRPPWI